MHLKRSPQTSSSSMLCTIRRVRWNQKELHRRSRCVARCFPSATSPIYSKNRARLAIQIRKSTITGPTRRVSEFATERKPSSSTQSATIYSLMRWRSASSKLIACSSQVTQNRATTSIVCIWTPISQIQRQNSRRRMLLVASPERSLATAVVRSIPSRPKS